MTTAFTVVIPARYGSTRFPGKPLKDRKSTRLNSSHWE